MAYIRNSNWEKTPRASWLSNDKEILAYEHTQDLSTLREIHSPSQRSKKIGCGMFKDPNFQADENLQEQEQEIVAFVISEFVHEDVGWFSTCRRQILNLIFLSMLETTESGMESFHRVETSLPLLGESCYANSRTTQSRNFLGLLHIVYRLPKELYPWWEKCFDKMLAIS